MAKKHGFAAALVLQTVIGAAPLLAEATTAVDGYKPTENANAAKNDANTAKTR
jgi:hypothetical protein